MRHLKSARYWLSSMLCVTLVAGQPAIARAAVQSPGNSYFAYLPIARYQCAATQLIRDGSFEAGLPNPHWHVSSSQFSDVLDDSPTPAAHTGAWKAWLAGADDAQETVSQTLTLPPIVSQLQLTYWAQVSSLDNTNADTMTVQLRNASGVVVAAMDTLTDLNAGAWQLRSASLSVAAYAGQTMQLVFAAQTDTSFPTTFLIDDVGIMALCP